MNSCDGASGTLDTTALSHRGARGRFRRRGCEQPAHAPRGDFAFRTGVTPPRGGMLAPARDGGGEQDAEVVACRLKVVRVCLGLDTGTLVRLPSHHGQPATSDGFSPREYESV